MRALIVLLSVVVIVFAVLILLDRPLPAEGGADHVVAWLDPTVPVFGLLRWQRRDRTWNLVDWSPR